MADGRSTPMAPAGASPASRRAIAVVCVLALGGALLSRAHGESETSLADEPIAALRAVAGLDPEKVLLGERLFRDARLSHDNAAACSSCHRLEAAGDDGHARSSGADGRPLDFNTPTVFNAVLSFRLDWRGNFRTLEAQTEAALLDPSLMNASWEEVLSKLGSDPAYVERFGKIYGGAPERDGVLDALATFQRSLTTPGARFDRYLDGERNAITPDEERGYELFEAYGCSACHQGAGIGGNLFEKFGIFADPFAGQTSITAADLGRSSITGIASDRHVFRVPSLRNVAVTAPYFHDGRTASLHDAVQIMACNQLGRKLAEPDIDLIVKFLGTLTGAYHGRLLTGAAAPPPQ